MSRLSLLEILRRLVVPSYKKYFRVVGSATSSLEKFEKWGDEKNLEKQKDGPVTENFGENCLKIHFFFFSYKDLLNFGYFLGNSWKILRILTKMLMKFRVKFFTRFGVVVLWGG